MNTTQHDPQWSRVKYLMLALAFALLAILSTRVFHLGIRHYFFTVQFGLRWLFWFFVTVSGICLLPIIHDILSALHHRGQLPRFIDVLYQERFKNVVSGALGWIRTAASSLEGQLALLGLSILAVVMLLTNSGAIDDDRVDGVVYEFVSSLTERPGRSATEPVVAGYTMPVADCDSVSYFRRYHETMLMLRDAGVKAVMIDTRSMKGDALRLMQELREFEFIVFALGYDGRGAIILPYLKTREFSKGIYSIEPDETIQMHSVGNSRPSEVRQIVYLDKIQSSSLPFGTEELRDVALELLRKYLGEKGEYKLDPKNDMLLLANYQIPVTRDGWVYSRLRRNFTGWGFASSTRFLVMETRLFTQGARDYAITNLRSRLAGKIVFIRESGQDMYAYSTADRFRYGHILTNLVEKNFLRKSESGHLWFILACLTLSAFAAHRFRPLAAFLITFALGVCAIVLGAFLYDSQHLIVDIFYPILATSVAMFVFPIVALGHRVQNN